MQKSSNLQIDSKVTFHKVLGHLRTITVHKYWVFYYACKLGIPWRGLIHDLSKFSPVEFWESVRYWDGKSSPIPRCKADRGYSLAWQHHKGRNPHHYEYWVDNLDKGGIAIKMPWLDMLEMVADYLGAGRAYQGKGFTFRKEYEWWQNQLKIGEKSKMHQDTKNTVEHLFYLFQLDPKYLLNFKEYSEVLRNLYEGR